VSSRRLSIARLCMPASEHVPSWPGDIAHTWVPGRTSRYDMSRLMWSRNFEQTLALKVRPPCGASPSDSSKVFQQCGGPGCRVNTRFRTRACYAAPRRSSTEGWGAGRWALAARPRPPGGVPFVFDRYGGSRGRSHGRGRGEIL